MIQFENTIEINKPIAEIFDFIANFENIPRWNYFIVKVSQIDGGKPAIGTVYQQVRKNDEQNFQIIDLQPKRAITVRTTPSSKPYFERTFTFEETPAGTRIIDTWELETGLNKLVERLGKGKIKAAVADNLGKLKQLLERGETQLQDGRMSKL
jgi:uncharacterized membrane protein